MATISRLRWTRRSFLLVNIGNGSDRELLHDIRQCECDRREQYANIDSDTFTFGVAHSVTSTKRMFLLRSVTLTAAGPSQHTRSLNGAKDSSRAVGPSRIIKRCGELSKRPPI